MREVVLDTETTGLNPGSGHRIVEIGCVELHNHVRTGRSFHRYVNPERDMPEEAFAIHGTSGAFLAEQPVFAEAAGALLEFLGVAPIVAHNASFDLGFLNAELTRVGMATLPRGRTIDTVTVARRRFPGAQVSLDALCRRFEIDVSARTKHGALLDAELLADVYLELMGGRQPDLALTAATAVVAPVAAARQRREPRPHAATEAELVAHAALVAQLNNPIWLR